MGKKNCNRKSSFLHTGFFRLVVLIPHRDTYPAFWRYKGLLFRSGFEGAYAFPPAIPLALLSQPLSQDALKVLARSLREAALGVSATGKIAALPTPEFRPAWGEWGCYGLPLKLPAPDWSRLPSPSFIITSFSPLLLPLALIPPGSEPPAPETGPPPPDISFRAAAVANMTFEALPLGGGGYSYRWASGKPRWLTNSAPATK